MSDVKEQARQAYRDQQCQDTEGGCGEPVGFITGYLACYRAMEQKLSDCEKRSAELYDKGLSMHVEIGDLKEKLSATEEKLRHFEERVDNQNATVEEAIRQQQAHRQTEEKLKIAVEALEYLNNIALGSRYVTNLVREALTKIKGE